MPRNSGKTNDTVHRPTKYESMRMKTGKKTSKNTSRKLISISRETVEDCLSSWLTATGFISKNEFVSSVGRGQTTGYYFRDYVVEISDGSKEEEA